MRTRWPHCVSGDARSRASGGCQPRGPTRSHGATPCLHEVSGELARRDPSAPAWTWWDPEPTVGFWLRRLAHETSVHRADVESATGPVTPIASDLALDGIDELLTVHLPDDGFAGSVGWTLAEGSVEVAIDEVTVTGTPSDVLLWLWGRVGDEAVVLSGDEADLIAVRCCLHDATQ